MNTYFHDYDPRRFEKARTSLLPCFKAGVGLGLASWGGAAIAATENGSELSFGVYDYMSSLIRGGKKSASCCISE
eukprot:1909773-Rhodomonas_salina.1